MAEQFLDFTHKHMKPATKLVCLCSVAVALLVMDNRLSVISQLKNTVREALYPMQWMANQPVVWYDNINLYITNQVQLKTQNEILVQENLKLQADANDRAGLLLELNEIKALNQIKLEERQDGIMAEIIAVGQDPLAGKFFINKGSHAGLKLGQAVVDQEGLIGQIVSLQKYTAEVIVPTHNKAVIPVMNTRTGVRTLLYGNSQGLELRYMPNDADLKPNDVMVTSGLDDVYPAGIPVAKVAAAKHSVGSPYYKAETVPVAKIDKTSFVLVLPLTPKSLDMPTGQLEETTK